MVPDNYLPIIFASLTAFSVLVYAILDGYDLGVGILLPMDNEHHRDRMIASIGPFWDANETWLVLAVGLLLIAFPSAHSVLLKEMYLPAAIMLVGLILRGVAFDFRAKVAQGNKRTWDYLFKIGSVTASASQGFMLGMYVMGFETGLLSLGFCILSALGVTMAYGLIGSCWLIMKTEHQLQTLAVKWAKKAGRICFVGILVVCVVNPLINDFVFARWTSLPWAYLITLVPALCFILFVIGDRVLARLPAQDDAGNWLPFLLAVLVFICCFTGLSLSFYPYVVPGQMTIWEGASAAESLQFILYGAVIVIPCIFAYTLFSYRVFWGKVDELRYY